VNNLPDKMIAIDLPTFGGAEVLRVTERPVPELTPGRILIRVEAAGLNHGDLMQRRGLYPPPPGESDLPGLEVAGRVAAVGEGVTGWSVGDTVCALLAGGGYAQYAAAPAEQCLPIPDGLSMVEAAGLVETIFTCWMTLVDEGGLKAGDIVLIHGGSSGIGTMGIALAKALGATVFTTAGSAEKCQVCVDLGADLAINYKEEDFVERIKATGKEVNIVLDMVGGDYLTRDLPLMAYRGRHISIGLLGGFNADLSMGLMLMRQLRILGISLRGRSIAEKAALAEQVHAVVWPMIEAGKIKPVIYATLPLREATNAHRMLEAGGHIGKIILTVD
jgi:NADPH2:quinone reductase